MSSLNPMSDQSVHPGAWVDSLLEPSSPSAAAIVDQHGEKTSYSSLVQRVGGLSAVLRERGVGRGDRVAVALPRSPELVVAMLSILDIAAAYIIVDPDYPVARRLAMLNASRPTVVLADEPGDDPRLLCTDEWRDVLAPRCGATGARNDDLAYVAFTSGTSGEPKGVAVGTRALGRYVAWCSAALPSLGDGTPLFASAAFDHAATCIFPPLLAGEPLKLLPELGDGREFGHELLARGPYSFVKATPSHLKLLSRSERADLGAIAGLVMLGGERCEPSLVASLRERDQRTRVMNHYGPTEATVGCFFHEVPETGVGDAIPIGRPMPHASMRLESGKLLVGGECLADGYWVAGAVADLPPFQVGADGCRWYDTGDLVQVDSSGLAYYVGRADRQVKVLGHRVEPAEVESVLMEQDSVEAAVVFKPSHGERLVALVTPEDGARGEALLAPLRERVSAMAIPNTIERTARIPTTVHGKLDVAEAEALIAGAGAVAVSRQSRRSLALVWGEILGIEVVADEDDFFDLGGDSLAAVELMEWLEHELGVHADLALLFMHPTLGGFRAALAETASLGQGHG